jgi:hypothetical protein
MCSIVVLLAVLVLPLWPVAVARRGASPAASSGPPQGASPPVLRCSTGWPLVQASSYPLWGFDVLSAVGGRLSISAAGSVGAGLSHPKNWNVKIK